MNKIYQLISRSTLIALCAISFTMFSCEGDEGPIGPKGDTGAQGEQGEQGQPGESSLTKSGYFEGTITGTRQDDTPFTETFKYEYAESPVEVLDEGYVWLVRYNDASFNEELEMELYNDEDGGIHPDYFDFEFIKTQNNSVFYFDANYSSWNDPTSSVAIANFTHNTTTGILTFDFTYTDEDGENNSTGNPVTITGKFNSGHKMYSEVIMRKK